MALEADAFVIPASADTSSMRSVLFIAVSSPSFGPSESMATDVTPAVRCRGLYARSRGLSRLSRESFASLLAGLRTRTAGGQEVLEKRSVGGRHFGKEEREAIAIIWVV